MHRIFNVFRQTLLIRVADREKFTMALKNCVSKGNEMVKAEFIGQVREDYFQLMIPNVGFGQKNDRKTFPKSYSINGHCIDKHWIKVTWSLSTNKKLTLILTGAGLLISPILLGSGWVYAEIFFGLVLIINWFQLNSERQIHINLFEQKFAEHIISITATH